MTHISLSGNETVVRNITVDPSVALIALRRQWLREILGKHFENAYLSEGHWFSCYAAAHPDFGKDTPLREATGREGVIWDGLNNLDYHFKNNSVEVRG